jgi:hypothetical protein
MSPPPVRRPDPPDPPEHSRGSMNSAHLFRWNNSPNAVGHGVVAVVDRNVAADTATIEYPVKLGDAVERRVVPFEELAPLPLAGSVEPPPARPIDAAARPFDATDRVSRLERETHALSRDLVHSERRIAALERAIAASGAPR